MYKERIKELREDKNITQQSIANILGIARGLYGQYEIEYSIIPIIHLISISKYFNVSLDYIFNFTDIKNYNYISKNINIDFKKAGLRLKEFRKEKNLTQSKLADTLNTNRSVIANYERARNLIATPFLYTICKNYEISADYLLGLNDNPKYLT